MKKDYVICRIVSLVLVIAMLISMMVVPGYAAENTDGEYTLLEVSVEKTTLRSDCYEKSEALCTVYENTILFCKSTRVNKHGNVWYECIYFPESGNAASDTMDAHTAWVYSGKVTKHEHTLTEIEGEEGQTLRFCRCGYCEVDAEGMTGVNSMALPQPGIDLAEVALVWAWIKSMGGLAFKYAAVAAPYILIPIGVVGVTYLAYVRCDTSTAEVVDIKKMTKEFKSGQYLDGSYYYSAIYKKPGKTDGVNSTVLLLPTKPMDLDEATSYMETVIAGTSLLKGAVENIPVRIDSIYTPLEKDARKLCEALKKKGYFYGQKTCVNECSEHNLKKENLVAYWLYFEHFHIHRSAFSKMSDISSHIFFGIPFTYNGYPLEVF